MDFTDDQLLRYARHIILPEVGGEGQARLLAARVLVVGAGGLGSPLLMYLAAAGVGTLGVVDDDRVDLSNLQRQIVHATSRVGAPKTASARATLAEINPEVRVETHAERLTAANAPALIGAYDLVADGSDNFATRYLVNDACYLAKKPLVSAAMLRFDGQVSTFKAYLGGDNPCYRCLFREPPGPGLIPSCSEAGILGALAGTLGALQATEALKEILGIGDSLSGSLLLYDALSTTFQKVLIKPDPECPLCGPQATINDLSLHQRETVRCDA
ncbi:MAG: ThiF family adenylyltransferase [Alphaproteobacteria bacterium]